MSISDSVFLSEEWVATLTPSLRRLEPRSWFKCSLVSLPPRG